MEQNNSVTGQQVAGPAGVANASGGGPASAVAGPSQLGREKKRGNYRHSEQQIAAMEAYFKECPHPDRMQRTELARTLGLHPPQVKFWFQNKRNQYKAQIKREKNDTLRFENNVLRTQNQHYMGALRNKICQACRGGGNRPGNNVRMENVRLREELERVKSQVERFMTGRNSEGNVIQSQVDPGVGYANTSIANTSSGVGLNLPNVLTTNKFRKSMFELVVSAAEELKVMATDIEPFWIPSADGQTCMLNQVEYFAKFPHSFGPTRSDYICEASRYVARVLLNPKHLLNVFFDVNEWSSMFSPIVARALTMDVVSGGENYNTALQVMSAEYQTPTPLVPNREACFARYCRQHCEGMWAVVDVSLDNILSTDPEIMTCYKKPSGCVIQEMADGTSMITWIEHVYVDYNGVSNIFKRLLLSGLGFGANRWVSTLERQCQRLATINIAAAPSIHDFNHLLMSSPEGKRGILKLSERMVNSFYSGITGPKAGKWTKLYNFKDDIRVMSTRVVDDPGLPTGTLISIATSFVLPLPPSKVFDFFRDHRSRKEWDILADGNDYEPVFNISCNEEDSNCVSIYKVPSREGQQGHMLVLQESWKDPVASHIVFLPAEIGTINVILSGGDPNSQTILPSGFTILPDGGPSSRVEGSCGTLLTVSFQILTNKSSMADIDMEDATEATQLLRSSCQKIKHALGIGGPNT